MNLFWIHGGPGYNSRPESLLLDHRLADMGFNTTYWAHPSTLRGDETDNSWTDYTAHLQQAFSSYIKEHGSCFIVAHSFGARTCLPLLEQYHNHIQGIIWISGATSMLETFNNIFHFLGADYLERGFKDQSEQVKDVLAHSKPTLPYYLSHISLIVENENFLQYYWTNKQAMESYYPCFQDQWSIDMECFAGVISTLPEQFPNLSSTTPALLLYGENEMVINNSYEQNVASTIFENGQIKTFGHCSHFLHMEDQERFARELEQFAVGVAANSTRVILQ